MAYTPLTLRCDGGRDGDTLSVPTDPTIVRRWTYKTEDAIGDVNTADYFKDARNRGMSVGDVVLVVVMSSGSVSAAYDCLLMAIDAGGAGDISNGVSIVLTNSD